MRLLLDTHLLIWTAAFPCRLPATAVGLIEDRRNDLMFSVISIWEVAIKRGLVDLDKGLEPSRLRRMLLDQQYQEVAVEGRHAISAGLLPPIHKDPYDRMLIAQASIEGALLLTSDREVARYPGSIRLV